MNDKENLKKLLKDIEIISLDLIDKGKLNDNSLHEIVLYAVSVIWEKDILDTYINKVLPAPAPAPAPKPELVESNNVIPFNKE